MKRFKLAEQPPAPIINNVSVTGFDGIPTPQNLLYDAIVDTGSSHTVVPLGMASVVGSPTNDEDIWCRGITGHKVLCPVFYIQLNHPDFGIVRVKALGMSMPKQERILIGRDAFVGELCRPMTLAIDWRNMSWTFGGSSWATSVIYKILARMLGKSTAVNAENDNA